jgi:hypothetical protein
MDSTSLIDGFQGLFFGMLNSSLWPVLFALAAMVQVALYLNTQNVVFLCVAVGAAMGLALWRALDAVFRTAFGIDSPQDAGLSMWWLLVPVLAVVGIVAFVALTGRAEDAVPTPEFPTAKSELTPLVAWLLDLGRTLPTKHSATLAKIRDHITALESLRAELPAGALSLGPITKMVSSDLRDLVVRYKRVELARKFLPNMETAGEDELTGGLMRIEAAIAEQRAAVADAAVNDLKVQELYIEAKHAHPEQLA